MHKALHVRDLNQDVLAGRELTNARYCVILDNYQDIVVISARVRRAR